ncbi:MAG: hypothetical protein HWN68_02940 [Desulfobacterales bacterium]|nr:hypothetical protein [Desulfobacterales bacterium]
MTPQAMILPESAVNIISWLSNGFLYQNTAETQEYGLGNSPCSSDTVIFAGAASPYISRTALAIRVMVAPCQKYSPKATKLALYVPGITSNFLPLEILDKTALP